MTNQQSKQMGCSHHENLELGPMLVALESAATVGKIWIGCWKTGKLEAVEIGALVASNLIVTD